MFSVENLSGANFKGADFSAVTKQIFDYTRLNYADMSDAKIPFDKKKESWRSAVFGCEFRHANLKGVSEDLINQFRDNSDLDGAITDKGVCKSVLVPFNGSQALPNDYWQANFHQLPNYAHLHYVEYTNIPFNPMVVTKENEEALKSAGYQFDSKQDFLKFNEGQEIHLSSGRNITIVDANEFSKLCCDTYLGKDKVKPKEVVNDNQVWFVKFNPTARAPRNALEFIPVTGKRDFDTLLLDKNKFVTETKKMIDSKDIAIDTDVINRCEHVILYDGTKECDSMPSMGDIYPTYFFSNGDFAVEGDVIVAPFVIDAYNDKTKFEIGEPYDVRTMNNFVEDLMKVQNEKRIEYYKNLSLVNGIVPKNISDKDLTKLAKQHMILIHKPWQLEALTGEFNEKSMQNIHKVASSLDCLTDKETLAMQQNAKEAKFLYYDTMDIAKQMEFIANDIRKEKGIDMGKEIPKIGDKSIDKLIIMYNEAVLGKKHDVAEKSASTVNLKQKASKKQKDKDMEI